jgi:hypothetical protein
MGLERGSLSLVTIIEELLEWKSSGSSLENREYGRMDPSRWPRSTLYLQTLALTSPIGGGRSVCIVRSRTQASEFIIIIIMFLQLFVGPWRFFRFLMLYTVSKTHSTEAATYKQDDTNTE